MATPLGVTMFSPGSRRMAVQSFFLGLGPVGLGQAMLNWAELSWSCQAKPCCPEPCWPCWAKPRQAKLCQSVLGHAMPDKAMLHHTVGCAVPC